MVLFIIQIEEYSIAVMYTQILKIKRIGISMTEENDCYENAIAKRVNGILKKNFILIRPLIT